MNSKACSKCKEIKPLSEFSKNKKSRDGHKSYCKVCAMDYNRKYYGNPFNRNRQIAYLKQYQEDHRVELSEKQKAYRQKNKQKFSKIGKEYREKNKDKIKKQQREYYEKNQEKLLAIRRSPEFRAAQRIRERKLRLNPRVKLSSNFSRSIRQSLTRNGKNGKSRRHWEELVDYTLDELRQHIEKQFRPGMSWDNYGEWEIDHVRPVSSFNITSFDCEEFKQCWGLNNLQPLWRSENRAKSTKVLK